MQKTSVIIIGAGPAGLTAALQLKRFGIPALVFEGAKIGGLLHNANLVENYPGFPQGMRGGKLVNLLKKQVENVGVEFLSERVISLGHDGESFFAKTDKDEYHAKIAIVASGTKPRKFDDALIAEDAQSRVFYEVYDLLDVKNEEIIIVGAGDAAFDYALNLAGRGNTVTILNRSDELKCLPLLWERSQVEPRIRYLAHTTVETLEPGTNDGLLLRCISRREKLEIQADYLLGAIGRVPRLDTISPRVQDQAQSLESRALLYFIGDVKNGIYRQTSIAVGDGVRAAMQIYQQIENI